MGTDMTIKGYLAHLRAELERLHARKAALTKPGGRTWTRWGRQPFVETTGACLAELDRRIKELAGITKAIEQGRSV
jgi:hypothetical protein